MEDPEDREDQEDTCPRRIGTEGRENQEGWDSNITDPEDTCPLLRLTEDPEDTYPRRRPRKKE